jgi:hypothetical protein
MKLLKIYSVLLFVLIGVISFLPMINFVLGWKGDGGGP